MEQPQYLIDTNAVIDYLGKKLPFTGMEFMDRIIDTVPNVSVITKIEVLGFSAPDDHYQLLTNFMDDATVLDLTGNIVDVSIDIRKKYKAKLPDAIIAATASENGMPLATGNAKHFKVVKELVLKIFKP